MTATQGPVIFEARTATIRSSNLGAYAELRKAIPRFFMSVCLSILLYFRPHGKSGLQLDEF